ncbi:hypothetical protein BAUCODRAFT_144616 [Baudoinia panamericana UAMH 10762]|uniref:Cytochrome P450 n=1 Tax=Baudoinia panamericana (strain UAMH 10762) TaxID=717646 RepID=M2NPY1_BAUPA|nr:uncharacterized protein BAUCODRAFT_144616 [Baudoinia panamericana UAMH 10762]EMD01041.1 hypothetical protein BAUCODRAFT_144616 [Baudoinia panamericana UAMH 10762]
MAAVACPFTSHQALPQEWIDASPAVSSNEVGAVLADYDIFRQQCPLAYTKQYDGYWLMTRYEDVKAAALDSETFISSVKAVIPSDPRGLRRPPLNFDAPRHTPYRTALDRTLKPARIRKLAQRLEKHADELLAIILERDDRTGDICSDFAGPFAAWVEAEWLNLTPDKAPLLAKTAASWIDAWRRMDRDATTLHSTTLYGMAEELLEDRRQNPRDPEEDPASSLLLEKDSEGKPLDNVHLIGCLRQSLVVGMVAPPLLIGGIVHHLTKDPELQKQLRDNPDLVPAAVEEFVRLYSPYRGFARTVSKDVHMHGQTIKPGQPLSLTYVAANRDPAIFEQPHKFIMNRPNIAMHLGFGRGRHRCAGQPLARLAIQVALKAFLKTKRFETFGCMQYARMPEWGIISCPIRFEV